MTETATDLKYPQLEKKIDSMNTEVQDLKRVVEMLQSQMSQKDNEIAQMHSLLSQIHSLLPQKDSLLAEKDGEIAGMKKETTEIMNNPLPSTFHPIPPLPPPEQKKFDLKMEEGECLAKEIIIAGKCIQVKFSKPQYFSQKENKIECIVRLLGERYGNFSIDHEIISVCLFFKFLELSIFFSFSGNMAIVLFLLFLSFILPFSQFTHECSSVYGMCLSLFHSSSFLFCYLVCGIQKTGIILPKYKHIGCIPGFPLSSTLFVIHLSLSLSFRHCGI
jgi:hypothetical protein